MDNISVQQKVYKDGSKAWYLHFWDNEGKAYHSLKITKKQFDELRNKKFELYPKE